MIIGENVGFDSLINLPAGVMLTDTLSKIAVQGSTDGVERVALDLRSTPMPGAAEAPRTSYLELDYYSYHPKQAGSHCWVCGLPEPVAGTAGAGVVYPSQC